MTPIAINHMNGTAVVGGSADTIRAALRGASPLVISGKHCTGETVYLAPLVETRWIDDAVTSITEDIARRLDHPEHGEILYAYVDMTRLDLAPGVATREREIHAQGLRAAADVERRAAASIPSCHNCGDCPRCC